MSEQISPAFMKKFRLITQLLIFSILLNVGLCVALFHQKIGASTPYAFSVKPKSLQVTTEQPTNTEYLATINEYPFRELVAILADDTLLEQGYRKRDFALGVLVQNHYFHLDQALCYRSLSKRQVSFAKDGEEKEVTVFPGLQDHEYDLIIHYAVTEKWPLTTKGLFYRLQAMSSNRDPTLEHAFCISKEFHALETLFYQTGAEVSSESLLQFALEYGWDSFAAFCSEQVQGQDLSVQKRRDIILDCLRKRSARAAQILLETDLVFAMQKLDDTDIFSILELLQEKTEEIERFCLELLQSLRSDSIWQASAEKLYALHGQVPPEPLDFQEVLYHFQHVCREKEKMPRTQLEEIAWNYPRDKALFHTVSEGETLWKIARDYHVELQELIRINGLEDDQIQPGVQLLIP